MEFSSHIYGIFLFESMKLWDFLPFLGILKCVWVVGPPKECRASHPRVEKIIAESHGGLFSG